MLIIYADAEHDGRELQHLKPKDGVYPADGEDREKGKERMRGERKTDGGMGV